MNPTLEAPMDIALACANEIADQFTPGFFDDRMVDDVAGIIRKHFATTAPAGDDKYAASHPPTTRSNQS